MNSQAIQLSPELERVLWACYEYWRNIDQPEEERVICYSWVVTKYELRFGTRFHQSRLHELANFGLLELEDSSRGGNRRYYKLPDPEGIRALLGPDRG
jgi:hypothetical protein